MDDRVCPWWLGYAIDNRFRRLLHDPEKVLAPYVREGMIVADIGCGMGLFSIAMAKMVGEKGAVISVDIQREMLDSLHRRAERAGVAQRIRLQHAAEDDIGIRERVDFALAFWMVHEVKDIPRFFSQVSSVLTREGRFLIAEPKIHVTSRRFQEIMGHAREAGFRIGPGPAVRISRSALLSKEK